MTPLEEPTGTISIPLASPTRGCYEPWPVIREPWRAPVTEHRYDEMVVGATSRLTEDAAPPLTRLQPPAESGCPAPLADPEMPPTEDPQPTRTGGAGSPATPRGPPRRFARSAPTP